MYWYFKRWEEAKVTDAMLTALREQLRVQPGRIPQPSAGIIDSQSVKGAHTVDPTCWTWSSNRTVAGDSAVPFYQTLRSASGGIQGLGSVAQPAS